MASGAGAAVAGSTSGGNIVAEWLRSLRLGQYSESFIDNGYDDLEICKQVGEPDLDAIGVLNPAHRQRLLHSVRSLREEGAASVYFALEEAAAVHEQCLCDSDGDGVAGPASRKEPQLAEAAKYADEYEEGKAELVKIPRIQLKRLLRERLGHDGIRLSLQPYSTPDGDRGYLEGLASRYADLFSTHYGDVLDHLEELRRREWGDEIGGEGRRPPPLGAPISGPQMGVGCGGQGTLTTSLSQPIYVPGKYSPSSCLTDKEEDEIYGFGYGVFGKQMYQRHQQKQMLVQAQITAQHQAATNLNTQPLIHQQQQNYQSCLSPRSAYFYEFPPSENCLSTAKKKATTFSRLLRGLKTSHRKEKHGSCSPKNQRQSRNPGLPPQRVDTPDSVLGSGLGLGPGPDTALRSMVDPRDYDRLRYLQLNGIAPNTFEETIHRLKVQEAMKKKEKQSREQEEILRDIRHGLLHLGRDGVRGTIGDDTYMYDEDARMMGLAHGHGHWYDEPPYESDPEDFLMGGGPVPTATIQNGRVCFTLNLRNEPRGEGVISLRSAGDISIPRENSRIGTRRGLILPQSGPYPPTIIPLRTARDRESGDYAGSDIQSVSSRLSGLSVETSRSDQMDSGIRNIQAYRQMGGGYRMRLPEDGLSPNSSDYEEQEESETDSQHIATIHNSGDDSEGVSTLVGRVRGLRQDVQRKISRLRREQPVDIVSRRSNNDQAFPCSNSSFESLPSGSGSSTQALVRAGSNHSSISAEENRELSPTGHGPQILCRARAVTDYNPASYEKDALNYKKGEIIDVINMNASGIWRGILNNRIGHFKFMNVEVLPDRMYQNNHNSKWVQKKSIDFTQTKPSSVEEILRRINLHEHASVFVLNGYDDIELFKEIEPSDLDYLGIMNTDHRAKILTAVQLLHDMDCAEADIAGSSSEGDDSKRLMSHHIDSPFGRRQFLRDSGCYDAPLHIKTSPIIHRSDNSDHDQNSSDNASNSPNNLDAVVQQCNNEILKRVENSQSVKLNVLKDSDRIEQYHPNIPVPNSVAMNTMGNDKCIRTMDSYVVARGQTISVEPSRTKSNILNRAALRKNVLPNLLKSSQSPVSKSMINQEDSCESDHKLNAVKYVVGGGLDGESVNLMAGRCIGVGGGSCLSEKSSDSGVSSSSLSSAPREQVAKPQQL